jgi:hypothetical protein
VRTFLVVSYRRVLAYELFVKVIPRVTQDQKKPVMRLVSGQTVCFYLFIEWSNSLVIFLLFERITIIPTQKERKNNHYTVFGCSQLGLEFGILEFKPEFHCLEW